MYYRCIPLCSAAVFYLQCALFGANKGKQWQVALITSVVMNFLIDFAFSMVVSAVVIHYMIPVLAFNDIQDARKRVHSHVRKLFGAKDYRAHMDTIIKSSYFSSTEYLFASAYISTVMPDLLESTLVYPTVTLCHPRTCRRGWMKRT